MVLEFLNQNQTAFTVIFSALVAFATIVYAILTWRLVLETRKMREAQTEPNICVTIEPSEVWINFIEMAIQNIGLGPAYNIQFEVDPEFEQEKGKFLSELGFIKNGFKFLAPSQRFKFFLTSLLEDFEEKMKTHFNIKITFQNSLGKSYEFTYLIDFSHLIGLNQVGELPIYGISKNIEAIRKDIHNLSIGKKMKVVMYTKTEEENEKKKKLESAKKQFELKKKKLEQPIRTNEKNE